MSDELFEGLKDEISAKEKEMLFGKYRHVFTSQFGMDVLADILVELCHFGQELENADQVAQYNLGVYILSRMGVYSKANSLNVIRALASTLPAPKKEE